MTRPPILERVPAYRELATVWPTLLNDVMRFAMNASGDPAVRCGRLETFAFLCQLPEQVEDQAAYQAERETRRAERAASNGHAPSGAAPMKR
jgi:hypothetical protein